MEVNITVVGTMPGQGLTLPARVKAAEEVTLNARAAGRVTRFAALEGQSVEAGQIVVRFDAPEASLAREAARSERIAAQSALEAAARQHARMESLFVSRVVAAAELEAAAATHHAAEARLSAAESRLVSATTASEVRAPFAAVVVRRHVDPGADVSPGTPLVDLRSRGAVEIVAAVPEAAIPSLARAHFEYQSGSGPWRSARLARLDGMTDPNTRTRTAHLVPAESTLPEPGSYARVRIRGAPAGAGEPEHFSVPDTSLVRRGELRGVFLSDSSRATLRWLRLGRDEGGQVQVLSGLEAGDRVILEPARVHEGARVREVR
jgi:RND family efflux transporter MFP subunit